MKCKRKKPESCFTCTLPECIDDGNSAPDKEETRILNEALPDRVALRTKYVRRSSETPREP